MKDVLTKFTASKDLLKMILEMDFWSRRTLKICPWRKLLENLVFQGEISIYGISTAVELFNVKFEDREVFQEFSFLKTSFIKNLLSIPKKYGIISRYYNFQFHYTYVYCYIFKDSICNFIRILLKRKLT